MRKRSITKRWLVNSLGVIFVILVTVEIAFAFAIQNYFYSSAKQYMSSKMNMISSLLTRYSQDLTTNFSTEVRNVVENFSEKDKMELMAINSNGEIVITSSGFSLSADTKMPDYIDAQNASNGQGYSITKQLNGEKTMSVCLMISNSSSEFNAIRLTISLDEIDAQIRTYIITLAVACGIILVLMLSSGLYFVNSIVIPVRQINLTAKRFAKGDFAVRIQKKNDDEIGELCTTINHMADELSNAESMKNEFISSVSHELRTPLTAIKGWAETLNEMTDDAEMIKKGMKVIGNETDRLSQMVEELLDFSRIQNGRFTLTKTTMDILAELGDAVLIFTERAKHDGMQIIYNEPEMLPFVFGDKNRIRQVFINIIDNAIKYSDPGGIISIDARVENDKIKIAISDTGCGISAEDLPKVKTKFFKANHTRRGSGIGLAVVNEIVIMHGGEMDIMSEQGVGTTVVILLPTIDKKQADMVVSPDDFFKDDEKK
ncbi:MAG: HAMP domain-containing sensor histidine kinase [Oscillospiraceae bacterium]